MTRRNLLPVAAVAMTLLVAACSNSPKPQAHAITPAVLPSVAVARPSVSLPATEPGVITDERAILAAQRALGDLGYKLGKADGVNGRATRRAILAFQKDHALTEDGRLTPSLAKLLANLVAQLPNTTPITVAAGDSIVYSDGQVDSASHDRVVQWDQEGGRAIVAVRPSTRGWPPAARAGLDWATTHALDDGNGAPIQWSSTGVHRQFEIHVYPQLTPREADLAGAGPSCRRFELRAGDASKRYPGLACKNAEGDWYLPHTAIRLARPASALGAASPGEATPH